MLTLALAAPARRPAAADGVAATSPESPASAFVGDGSRVLRPAPAGSDDPRVISVSDEKVYRDPLKALIFVIAGLYVAAMMIAILVLTRPDAVDGAKVGLGL